MSPAPRQGPWPVQNGHGCRGVSTGELRRLFQGSNAGRGVNLNPDGNTKHIRIICNESNCFGVCVIGPCHEGAEMNPCG